MFASLIPSFASSLGGLGQMASAPEGPVTIAPTLGDIYGPQISLGEKGIHPGWYIGAGLLAFALFLKWRR